MHVIRGTLILALAAACGGGSDEPDAAPAGWVARAPIGSGPRLEGGVVALDDKVYLLGGFDGSITIVPDVAVYDPATDSWSAGTPMPAPLHHLNAAVADGKIYVTGALSGMDFTPVGDVWIYDPVADTWTAGAPMPAGSERGASATAVLGRSIVVAGGSRADAVADVSAYDLDADAWTPLPPLPSARYHAVAAAAPDGRLLVIGGLTVGILDGTSQPMGDVVAGDPVAGDWQPRAPLPTPRAGCAAGWLGGLFVCAGGETPLRVAVVTEAYDPVADAWSTYDRMLTPRAGTGGAVVGNALYVPGGAKVIAYYPEEVNEAFYLP